MAQQAVELKYTPQPKQRVLHNTTAKQILFGGAAGGSKSHGIRWDAILLCLENPGLQAYLFRKTFPELQRNHIKLIIRELPESVGRFIQKSNTFEFINGSTINFCYCDNDDDYLKYQGAEMHALYLDEATLFDTKTIIELRSRVRLGGFAEHVKTKAHLPRIVYATNPGGPSHNFLKRIFIDGREPMKIFYDESMKDPTNPNDLGWTSIFIPSKQSDNKYLDAGYASGFNSMSPERAAALRDGNWDVVDGAALHTLEKTKHMLKPFSVPRHWLHFGVLDWGSASPFSFGWYAVASEDTIINNNPHIFPTESNPKRSIFVPRGAIIRYDEWYGWTGKENEGLRLESPAVGRGIVERETQRNDPPMDYYICDSAAFNTVDGRGPAVKIAEATEGRVTFKRSRKNREANYDEILARLAGNPLLFETGQVAKHPLLFITSNCEHFWRTVPVLNIDTNEPDKGPKEGGEDHVYDELQYACASRPIIMTEEDRLEQLRAERRGNRTVDPYS